MEKDKSDTCIALSIVVPVFNEEDVINEFFTVIQEVRDQLSFTTELIFVNDGSSDMSPEILRKLAKTHSNVHAVTLSRNFGHQLAVLAGLKEARGEKAVFLDCDLQDPPGLISEMYDQMNQGYDVVAAKRAKREGEGLFKKVTAFMFYRFLKNISGTEIPLDIGDFQMINSKVLEVFKGIKGENLYIRGFIPWMGFKRKDVEYQREARKAGSTKYSIRKMLNLAINGVLSLSNVPLRMCFFLGFIVVLSSFLYILRILYLRYVLDITVTGWPSIMTVVLFLGGIQILFIGIVGEYIARIYQCVDDKPTYIISERVSLEE